MPANAGHRAASAEFLIRLIAALILAPLALAAVWAGSWVYAALVAIAAAIILYEWLNVCGHRPAPVQRALILAAMGLLAYLSVSGAVATALFGLAAAAFAVAAWGRHLPGWRALGILYAGLPAVALLLLRGDSDYGLAATLWLFATVWATDSAAYASGRLIGGPRIWPRVSPNKTWAGLAGGVLAAGLAGGVAARFISGASIETLVVLGATVSIAAQAGDFFESGFKRRFGAKDSGRLIPGHGGLMDRVDGLVAAALVAVAIGLARGGADGVGAGLLIW